MFDDALGWLLAHPLQSVGAMVAIAVTIALVAIPRIHEVTDHGHPRC